MKNLILFFLSIAVFGVASCTDIGTLPEPLEPLSREDSIKITLLKPAPTKEPYILLEDSGLEAELIATGLDSDNQINGRISLEDAERIEILGRPIFASEVNTQESEYYWPVYSRSYEVMPILKKDYKEKTGTELIVKKLSDVNAFKNLRRLYVTFDTEVIDSLNLSANGKLELFETYDTRIKIIDFNGCKKLKKVNIMMSPHPRYGLIEKVHISECSQLEYLRYVGDPRTLNVSQNTNLKYFEVMLRPNLFRPDIEIEKLDLCNNTQLEFFYERTGTYKNIYLSKSVYSLYETSKLQNTPNGFPQLGNGREVFVCE